MSAGRGIRRLPRTSGIPVRLCPARLRPASISRGLASCDHEPNVVLAHPRFYSADTSQYDTRQARDSGGYGMEDVDLPLEEQMLAIQDTAIKELEAQLGKSLEDAIHEDPAHWEEVLEGYEESQGNAQTRIETESAEPEKQLVLLRAAGASAKQLARQARNLFGDYLPADVLTIDEISIYKRLYGEPLPIEELQDEATDNVEEVDNEQVPENVLYGQDGAEVPYRLEDEKQIVEDMADYDNTGARLPRGALQAMSTTKAFGDAARAAEVAKAVGGEVIDDEEYDLEPDDEEAEDTRSHPLTALGRFATFPRTTFLPKDTFVTPVEHLMSNFSNKQLKEVSEKVFGGPGLPDSPLTPRSTRARQQLPIPLEASQQVMGQMEANVFITSVMPPTYASALATLVETRKRLGVSWLNQLLAKPGGPRILDAGSGGAAIIAWKEIMKAHWDSLHSSDRNPPAPPQIKAVVLTGSDTLRHRAAKLLENTTFVPRLPDIAGTRKVPTLEDDRPAQQRKQFDVIISSHSLFPFKEEWERKQHVQNLWSLLSDNGGVLIIIEKGIPRGFETVAAARDMLLERYIAVPQGQQTHYSSNPITVSPGEKIYQKSPGMIIAPCTNHDRCPLYKTSGVSKGRKDICSFQQRFIRPSFLQRIIGASDRNHDDVEFSYVAFMKGEDLRARSFSNFSQVSDPLSAPMSDPQTTTVSHDDSASQIQQGFEHTDPIWSDSPAPPPQHTLPRVLNQPLKRRGHVTLDLCTPQAEIRRWTIPKSFSRQAYRDARKARWGDLWALGAKTNIPRNLKLGTPEKELAKGEGMKGTLGKPRSRKERLRMKAAELLEMEEAETNEDELDEEDFMKMLDRDNLLDEDDADAIDAEDDGLIDMDTLLPKKASAGKKGRQPHAHAKLDGINVFGKQTPAKGPIIPRKQAQSQSQSQSQTQTRRHSYPQIQPEQHKPSAREQVIDTIEYTPGRIGEVDNLSAWAESVDSAAMEDEARRQLDKTGRRPTKGNSQRLKRELRRLRRESTKGY